MSRLASEFLSQMIGLVIGVYRDFLGDMTFDG